VSTLSRTEPAIVSLSALAIFAAAAHILLLFGMRAPDGALLGCLLGCILVMRPRVPQLPHKGVLMTIFVCLIPILVGVLATEDRAWDGLATWSLRAKFLSTEAGIEHAFFTEPAVFNFSRSYPLLQPLALANLIPWIGLRGSRLLFILFWLGFLAFIDLALRHQKTPSPVRGWLIIGAALTPILMGPGHGSVDSGFADLLHCMLLTAAAAGLITRNTQLAGLAAFLLPLSKTEGCAQVLLVLLAALLTGRRTTAKGIAACTSFSLALWLPLRAQLVNPAVDTTTQLTISALGVALPITLLLAGHFVAHMRRQLMFLIPGFLLLAISAWGFWHLASKDPLFATLMERYTHLDVNLQEWPSVIGTCLMQFVFARKFGLVFPLLILLLIWGWRRRELQPIAPALALFAGSLALVPPMLLTQRGEFLEIMLKEGVPRYFLASTGIAWIMVGLLAGRLLQTLSPRALLRPPVEERPPVASI